MNSDLSLRTSLRQRGVDPAAGVRQMSGSNATISLRSLIPPSTGGGTGGGEFGWLQVGFASFTMTETRLGGSSPCASVQLLVQATPEGVPVDVDGAPLELGRLYWLGARIMFTNFAPHFLAPYDYSAPGLDRQDFRFALTMLFPSGTDFGPDRTVWWRIANIDEPGAPDHALLLGSGGPPTGVRRHTFWQWSMNSPTLQRGQMLDLVTCVQSTETFASGQLGLEVGSQVGWIIGWEVPHDYTEGDTIHQTVLRQVYCRMCGRIVALHHPYTTCGTCGSSGPLIIKPVSPEVQLLTVPLGL